MTRVFNIVMLALLAAIYYVQNDGFGLGKPTPEPTTVAQLETPVEPTKAALTSAPSAPSTPAPATPTAAKPVTPESSKNRLTKAELAAINDRFIAQRLASSTLMREVPLTPAPKTTASTTATNAPLLEVSGSVVNARSAPTTRSDVLTRLRRGSKVIATGETQNNWAQVTVLDTGETVWMASRFLEPAS